MKMLRHSPAPRTAFIQRCRIYVYREYARDIGVWKEGPFDYELLDRLIEHAYAQFFEFDEVVK